MRELLRNRIMLLRLVSERSHITESTATTPDGAVAIWAAETAVQRELVDLLPVAT
ncbi:hypothetical protein D3C87_1813850 [compost metagenome]